MRYTLQIGILFLTLVSTAMGQSTPTVSGSPAQDLTYYQVEILVFRNLALIDGTEDPGRPPLPPMIEEPSDPLDLADEFPLEAEEQVTDAADDPDADISVAEPAALFFRPGESVQLEEIAASLRRSRGYRVLFHDTWTQPGFPSEITQTVDLTTLEQVRRAEAMGEDYGATEPGMSDTQSVETGSLDGHLGPKLTGGVTLNRERYLHLNVDIAFLDENGDTSTLDERRRMRSGELHFLDSPALGVIALVFPREDLPGNEMADQSLQGGAETQSP